MLPRIVTGFTFASLAAFPAHAGDLKLTITGVRSDAGQLMIGIYDSVEQWKNALANSERVGILNDKGRLIGVTMRAKPGSQSVEFPQLPPGRYAVIVFHDENDNGLFNRRPGNTDRGLWLQQQRDGVFQRAVVR